MAAAPLLTVTREGEMIKTFPIQGEVLLGRAEGCAIRLDDRAISRQHAIFRSVGGSIQVEKKSEFAPFSVNGEECTRAVLKEGDVVSIGPYLIKISTPPPARAIPPPAPVRRESPVELLDSLPDGKGIDLAADAGGAEKPSGEALDLVPDSNQAFNLELNENPVAFESPDAIPQSALDFAGFENGSQDPGQKNFSLSPPETFSKETGPVDEDGNTKISAPEKIAIQLIFPPGTANFTTFELTQDEISIGRGKNCTVVLNDKKSSRKSATIRRVGHRFFIKDLSSANGTFVNQKKISDEVQLNGDDLIQIGNVEFQFKAVSTDYKDREKNFLSLPPESDIPHMDIENLMSLAPNQPSAADPQNIIPTPGATTHAPAEFNFANHPVGPPGQLAGDMAGVPGILGVGVKGGKNKSLVEKFKALNTVSKAIWLLTIAVFAYWFMTDDDAPVAKSGPKKQISGRAQPSGTPMPLNFESLSDEKKQFVESRHAAAFDFYKNREFDKALFEIQKIFVIVPDYKDAREIERYAKEGKRKQEAIAEEQRKKEDEAKLKIQIGQLVDEAKKRMDKKEYEPAKEIFLEILTLDPDNVAVASWKKEIEAYEDELKVKEQAKQVQAQINKQGWEIFKEAMEFKKSRKFYSAIDNFQKTIDIGSSDAKLLSLSKRMIASCRSLIKSLRDPVLAEAKTAEEANEYSKAFELYQKATRIDPHHPEGYAGINRIKGILHDRAKSIYTEAVLAESYSDFNNAKKMFEECLKVSPKDDVYHDRAARKLSHYFKKDEGPAQ
jgi:pSer/pThr/pTyr-binding forkhead associated (FHA) protein